MNLKCLGFKNYTDRTLQKHAKKRASPMMFVFAGVVRVVARFVGVCWGGGCWVCWGLLGWLLWRVLGSAGSNFLTSLMEGLPNKFPNKIVNEHVDGFLDGLLYGLLYEFVYGFMY